MTSRVPSIAAAGEASERITLENYHSISYGRVRHSGKNVLDRVDVAIAEVEALKKAGGRSLVELTSGGIRPNPNGLCAVADATGVNIIMGCGYYVEDVGSGDLRDDGR